MEFLSEYGLFLAKAITIVVALIVVIGSLFASMGRQKKGSDAEIELTLLNEEYEQMEEALENALVSPVVQKLRAKEKKKQDKQEAKKEKKENKKNKTEEKPERKRIFVLDFDGDIRASDTEAMRHEISAVLTNATEADEVLLRLESGGGMVHSYGLAASQLQRIRAHNIPLTIAVDKVAASGGYMMACVANKILAAPFSIVGSIGVLAQIPNLHRLLKDNKIDFEQLSAGEYKRTLTMFGENTDKAREKMQSELEETHELFKDFIKDQRPSLDIEKVATGEHWLGTKALELGLVDQLQTSDDYLMQNRKDADLLKIEYKRKKTLQEKISDLFSGAASVKEKAIRDMDKPFLM